MRLIASFQILLLCLFRESKAAAPIQDDDDNKNRHDDFFTNQQGTAGCDIYLAPSDLGGWGVYAARDFAQYEIVEIAPRFLPLKRHWLRHSTLYDYYYGYTWQGNQTNDSFGVIMAGMTVFYNHGEKRNVVLVNMGHEPMYQQAPFYYAQALAIAALRDIRRGEELLSSYGEEDDWFLNRGLTMRKRPPLQELTDADLEARETRYCSKVFSGLGQASLHERVLPTQERERQNPPSLDGVRRFPIQDQPTAVSKLSVQAGQVLEMAPALVMPLIVVRDSPLAPMAIVWDDWNDEQKKTLLALREAGAFRMKALNAKTGWLEYVLHHQSSSSAVPEDAVILPIAGNLAMVRKVGFTSRDSNCRLEVVAATSLEDSRDDPGSAGLVLKLIASSDIQAGEELRLNLPDTSSWIEKMHLLQILASTGQPIPKHIVDTHDYDPRSSTRGTFPAATGFIRHKEL